MTGYLRYIVILLSAVHLSSGGMASDKNKNTADESCQSFVLIKGSSNINQFQFVNNEPLVGKPAGRKGADSQVRIPVHAFSTSNNRMLHDFHEMLKAEEYPFIHINIEPKESADFDEGSGLTLFKSEISIAGKTNEYVIPSEITSCNHSPGYMLKGKLKVKLTDFGIDPPTKVLGAVRVNNEVFINFVFRFEPEDFLTEDVP